MSQKRKLPRLLKKLAIGVVVLIAFLLLFVVAFIFNPLEGSVRDVRDVVPRGIDFFARKQMLVDDFAEFPAPWFWEDLSGTLGFHELQAGPIVQDLKRAGVDRALQQMREVAIQVRGDSGGWIDLLGDLIGKEVVVAGYMQDYTQAPPRPLAEPWWCCYMRVSWRVKAALGAAGFGYVQGKIAENGVKVESDGDLLTVNPPGGATLYLKRHLDVLMVANHKHILEQSQRLLDGNRDEEPLGQMAAYTDGAQNRIEKWADVNSVIEPNFVDYVFEPNAFDGFRRFAASWPDPANKESMNERVLASFLNLKGWQRLAGGLMFAENTLAATGQVVLNSKQHTEFQRSFYDAESRPREEWLDPFLAMVPENSCAAAAMRMPVGEFLQAMFGALEPAERDFLNEAVRRSTFQTTQLTDLNDLVDRLKVAFLSRAGFVFRRNSPDMSRDDNGELMVPVAARSPMPQVAWVFWLRPGSDRIVEDLVAMLRNSPGNFHIKKVWHLRVPFGQGHLPEPVTEFCNPQIPATGELAMIVFREFFVLSNSGPLIKDILRTRHNVDGNRSILSTQRYQLIDRELPDALNGFVWLRGKHLVPVLDDYLAFAEANSELPDEEWMSVVRPQTEEDVRRAKFARYQSKASIPPAILNGEFEQEVRAAMLEKWRREKSNFTAGDRAQVQQLRGMAKLLNAGYVQLELMGNFIRFQTKLLLNLR